MGIRKKSGNLFGGSLLNVEGLGIYSVKKFQLVLNKSRKSFVLEPTPTPTIAPTDVPRAVTPTSTPTSTPTPTPTPTPSSPTIVAFGYAAGGNFQIGGYSTDYSGNTWITGNTSTPNGYSPSLYKGLFYDYGFAVATDGNMWVAGGNYFTQPGFTQYEFSLGYSYDGQSWTGITDSAVSGDGIYTCVAYGNDDLSNPLWVAGGISSSSLAWSSDGLIWNYDSLGLNLRPRGVCFGKKGGQPWWIAVGEANPKNFANSPDGMSWNEAIVGTTEDFWCIAYAELTDTWLAGCTNVSGSNLYKSVDGVNFTPKNTATGLEFNTACYGIAYSSTLGSGQGRWVAVGDNGVGATIFYSDDNGDNWYSSANSDTFTIFPNEVYAVCWNGQNFIAVGSDCKIAWSPDGDTWTASSGVNGIITTTGRAVASIPGPDMYPSR
jgi:hypothetical protein